MSKKYRPDQLAAIHRRATRPQAYYSIISVGECPDDSGEWEVLYLISGDRDDADRPRPLTYGDLKNLLQPHFAGDASPPRFYDEEYKNTFSARVGSQERALRLASELAYVFEQAGLQPMTDDKRLYQPQPPRSPRP